MKFHMDNGAGITTVLYQQVVTKIVWRDAPPGKPHSIEFADLEGVPVDTFDQPLEGNFIDQGKST